MVVRLHLFSAEEGGGYSGRGSNRNFNERHRRGRGGHTIMVQINRT